MNLTTRRRGAGTVDTAATDDDIDAAFMQSSLSWYRFAHAPEVGTWCRPMSGGEFCVVHDLWAIDASTRREVIATVARDARAEATAPPADHDRWLVTLAPAAPKPHKRGGLVVKGSRPVAWGRRSADVLLAVYDLFTFGTIRPGAATTA